MKKHVQYLVLTLLLAVILLPRQAQAAGIATDDLRIRVGYFGMDTDEYVDVDTYHWSQLENDLPQHRQAYTFLRNGDDGKYRVVVDSAKGFYIDDLLAYACFGVAIAGLMYIILSTCPRSSASRKSCATSRRSSPARSSSPSA